jgi:hypothetical protein
MGYLYEACDQISEKNNGTAHFLEHMAFKVYFVIWMSTIEPCVEFEWIDC